MMASLTAWWDGLDWGLQLFYALAIPSTAVLLVQTALLLLGGDADDVPDEIDAVGDGGIGLVSARTLVPFVAGFGWTGVVCLKNGLGMLAAIPVALAVGAVLMGGVYVAMRLLWGLRQSGTLNYANAVGEVGTVYLPIPPSSESAGKVEVMVQGRLVIMDAFTHATRRIGNRERVKVIETYGPDSVLVEPLEVGDGTANPTP